LPQESSLIAIVDDDQLLRASLERLIRSFGYIVETFPAARDFLEFARSDQTSCLIADIHMPGMTGIELHQQLLESGRRIPTILMTAYPDDAVRERALKDGVRCYLRKPFDDAELLRCVRAALASP